MFYPELCEVCSKRFDEATEKAKPYALLYTDFLELLCSPCKVDTQSKKETLVRELPSANAETQEKTQNDEERNETLGTQGTREG